jgi:hypothetical protein
MSNTLDEWPSELWEDDDDPVYEFPGPEIDEGEMIA